MTSPVARLVPRTDVAVRGPYDLTGCARFLEAHTADTLRAACAEPGTVRLAFPVEGPWRHAGVLVRQRDPGIVRIEPAAPPDLVVEATAQARRILCLDLDGVAFQDVVAADSRLHELWQPRPGLRPPLLGSPYEAACWAVLSMRFRTEQAAKVRERLAELHGRQVDVGGRVLPSFPDPAALCALDRAPGVPARKLAWLRGIAEAAVDGRLDAAALCSMEPADAVRELRRFPGIGRFAAELILVRGAGHPDVFPVGDERLHVEMALRYDVDPNDLGGLERIAERWRPYRSWAALLLRAAMRERTGEGRGSR